MKRFIRMLAALTLAMLLPLCAVAEDAKPLLDPNDPHIFTMFADWTWLEYDTFEGGITQDWMREQTGITIDLTRTADAEQLNLMIASGDLPDLIACSAIGKVSKLSDSDLCWPFQELIDQYVPEWQIPEVEKKLNAYFSQDGQYYMLKNEFNTVEQLENAKNIAPSFELFHMRQDIYEALGSPPLKNKQDFFALLEMVKQQYPDMVPLTLSLRGYQGAIASLVGYDAYMPKDADGNLVYMFSSPGWRDMMLTLNEMYRAGYIQADNLAFTSDEQTFQNLYAGKAFMVTHYSGNDEQIFTAKLKAAVPEGRIEQVPLPEGWNLTIPVSGWASMFITKNCSDPGRAIKMLYWAKQYENSISLCNGVKGVDWDFDEAGNIIALERRLKAFEDGTATELYKQMAYLMSADNFIVINNGYYATATPQTRAIFDEAVKRARWSNAVDLAAPKSGTDAKFQYDDLTNLDSEYFGRLCTAASEEEFNQVFDELMETANKAGLQEVNAYMTQTYRDVCELLGTN
ncbi:MAG: extracellular solute-binding protein [Oscillospiraceae bacterium]|jgi:putative aldouronate transport system substrate-binding protein|nr:extracellular solute-binding protein [Oscillospiraceae bacterium]